ncbi:MAG: acetylglutamate kinase [Phycisphaeraceae bacterium]|nr:acetylglutamate kinase [Phycisphaeraceae bacterium]
MSASGPLIVKIGGTTLENQAEQDELWKSLVALAVSHAGGLILVHGGGKAVDRLMDRLAIKPQRVQGLRVTPDEQIPEIVGVLAGTVNKSLVGCIRRAGGRGVGLSLGDGAMLTCRKVAPIPTESGPADLGRVGEVAGGNAELARTLLQHGYIPVLCSIGLDESGKPLNLNADDAAAGLARALKASALVLLTDVEGIKNKAGSLVPQATPEEIERLIASGDVYGGMIPKTRAAAKVANETGADVVILSGDRPEHLLRWSKGEQVGTRITAS